MFIIRHKAKIMLQLVIFLNIKWLSSVMEIYCFSWPQEQIFKMRFILSLTRIFEKSQFFLIYMKYLLYIFIDDVINIPSFKYNNN
jgi:hypothetical protein